MIDLNNSNNFFTSYERSIRLGLQCKFMVVLSNNDACIISRSNQAKALGYRICEHVFRVKMKI